MSESFVNVTEGSGKKLHTNTRDTGSDTVHDEFVILGEQPFPSYVVSPPVQAIATNNSHLLQIMAGSSKKLYIRRITLTQFTLASAVATATIQIYRLTTAGTGGTAQTIHPFDTSAAAAGATAMTLPTAKGTEAANPIMRGQVALRAAHPQVWTDGYHWIQHERQGAIVIPAGTSNGIVIKNESTDANAAILIRIEFDESVY